MMAVVGRAVALVGLLAGASAEHDPENYVYSLHSFSHPYSDSGLGVTNWEVSGDTVVSDQHVRLTPDHQSRKGAIWNVHPWNPPRDDKNDAGWEVHMTFNVNGQGTTLYGDGFAMWYTDGMLQPGSVFGSADGFRGIGVFFDTYSNFKQGHSQYISVMYGDGSPLYDHDKDGGDAKIAGCSVDFRGLKMEARIVYESNGILRMYTAKPDAPWEECFIVRRVKLPAGYHFGLSAATGDLADNHDVLSFKVSDPQPMDPEEVEELAKRVQMDKDAGVETEVHHDPQYENDGSEAVGTPIPLHYSLMAIIGCAVILGIIAMTLQSKSRYDKTHFNN
mmetsp:Transcript_12137/g.31184  ORF Transcript_12137/g.31184 Transcript_12137/m.31184 type:complete len:333 (+) Transcript_12137:34-1032(+)